MARATPALPLPTTAATTDLVAMETRLLLHRGVDHRAPRRIRHGSREGVSSLEKVSLADLAAAWDISTRLADQKFSIVDRTSFAVMQRLSIARAATLDDDFAIYRDGRDRDKAFEVLR